MFRRIIAAAAVPAAAAAITLASSAASAAVVPSVHYTANSAGYQTVQSGWRFRFVSGCTFLRTADQNAAIGVGGGLANPSNGDTAHVAVSWNGDGYTPYVEINGESTSPFASDLVISAHDTVCSSVYYDTTTGWLTFAVTDQTSGVQRTFGEHYGFAQWFSAGLGVQDTRTLGAESAHATLLNTFSSVRVTSYNVTRGGLSGAWNAQAVAATQDGSGPSVGNAVTIVPGVLGSGFSVSEGAVAAS